MNVYPNLLNVMLSPSGQFLFPTRCIVVEKSCLLFCPSKNHVLKEGYIGLRMQQNNMTVILQSVLQWPTALMEDIAVVDHY